PGTPPGKALAIEKIRGDDDHPGYSDHQISEALTARVINAVASNPDIWKQSVIILSYDESDGFYDHVPPRILSYGPDHLPLARGIKDAPYRDFTQCARACRLPCRGGPQCRDR